MSFQTQLNASLANISAIGNTALDLQMKKALLEEQRDRVNVHEGVYVPGPLDGEYLGGFDGLQVAGLSLGPAHLIAIAAVALYLIVRK